MLIEALYQQGQNSIRYYFYLEVENYYVACTKAPRGVASVVACVRLPSRRAGAENTGVPMGACFNILTERLRSKQLLRKKIFSRGGGREEGGLRS